MGRCWDWTEKAGFDQSLVPLLSSQRSIAPVVPIAKERQISWLKLFHIKDLRPGAARAMRQHIDHTAFLTDS